MSIVKIIFRITISYVHCDVFIGKILSIQKYATFSWKGMKKKTSIFEFFYETSRKQFFYRRMIKNDKWKRNRRDFLRMRKTFISEKTVRVYFQPQAIYIKGIVFIRRLRKKVLFIILDTFKFLRCSCYWSIKVLWHFMSLWNTFFLIKSRCLSKIYITW